MRSPNSILKNFHNPPCFNMLHLIVLFVWVAPVLIPRITNALSSGTSQTIFFASEEIHLLNSTLAPLSQDAASNFEYPTSNTPSTAKCKTFPRDSARPDDSRWESLNNLTGNALIKTVPISCSLLSRNFLTRIDVLLSPRNGRTQTYSKHRARNG